MIWPPDSVDAVPLGYVAFAEQTAKLHLGRNGVPHWRFLPR